MFDRPGRTLCNQFCDNCLGQGGLSEEECDDLRNRLFALRGITVFPCEEAGTPTSTPTGTFTPVFTATATSTPEGTATETPPPPTDTPEATATFTAIATATATSTPEGTATETPPPPTDTPEATATFTAIATATATSTAEGTATETPEATATFTAIATPTGTSTAEGTATETPEATATFTAIATPTGTSTAEGTATETPTPVVTVTATSASAGGVVIDPDDVSIFRARLSGDQEVPPVTTTASGRAVFKLKEKKGELRFGLSVIDIDNITMAHIHCGLPGVNGPIVAFLFGPVASFDPTHRRLAKGTITSADVIAVPDSPACPGGIATFDDLIAKIRAGGAYANVHTTEFPAGEIRGAITLKP